MTLVGLLGASAVGRVSRGHEHKNAPDGRTGRDIDCSTAFNSAALWPLAPVWTSGVTGVVGRSVYEAACRRFRSLLEFDGTALLELDGAGLSNARGAAVDAYGEMSVLADTPEIHGQANVDGGPVEGEAGSCWRLTEEMPSDLVLRESLLTLSAGSNTPLWRRSDVRGRPLPHLRARFVRATWGEIQRQMLLARPLPQRQHGCGSREEGEVLKSSVDGSAMSMGGV